MFGKLMQRTIQRNENTLAVSVMEGDNVCGDDRVSNWCLKGIGLTFRRYKSWLETTPLLGKLETTSQDKNTVWYSGILEKPSLLLYCANRDLRWTSTWTSPSWNTLTIPERVCTCDTAKITNHIAVAAFTQYTYTRRVNFGIFFFQRINNNTCNYLKYYSHKQVHVDFGAIVLEYAGKGDINLLQFCMCVPIQGITTQNKHSFRAKAKKITRVEVLWKAINATRLEFVHTLREFAGLTDSVWK